ncbi:hypothetical protein BUE80_DR013403 [Diplocarpon rosae]|nr:hypothetical protein BUE80_DR013403 [Diplocarpon rosae]
MFSFSLFSEFSMLSALLMQKFTPEKEINHRISGDYGSNVFQLESPLRVSYEETSCTQVVIEHDFTASDGAPYMGLYSPPADCDFTSVIFNMSITSHDIDYDRLGLISFGDIELWRTTTVMPVRTGIYSTVLKDVTVFDPLFRAEQKVIMQLDDTYHKDLTGQFNVTVTALFYDDKDTGKTTPADIILPISPKIAAKNQSSVISLPDSKASAAMSFPKNVERAVVSVLASGNGPEQFWFNNFPIEYEKTVKNSSAASYDPFREVQLLIDGELAGAVWPSQTVFTGGMNAGVWNPLAGMNAYDIPNFEIDVSPWLGLLCDGKSHAFELKVFGYNPETSLGVVESNWWISGSIFLWLDKEGKQTTGTAIESSVSAPLFQAAPINARPSEPDSLVWLLLGQRNISHTTNITTSSGSRELTWSQSLFYENAQEIVSDYNKSVFQNTISTSTFSPAPKHQDFSLRRENVYGHSLYFTQDYAVPMDPTSSNSSTTFQFEQAKESTNFPIIPYLTRQDVFDGPSMLLSMQFEGGAHSWNNSLDQIPGRIGPEKRSAVWVKRKFHFLGPISDGSIALYERSLSSSKGDEASYIRDKTKARYFNRTTVNDDSDWYPTFPSEQEYFPLEEENYLSAEEDPLVEEE